VPAGLVNYMAKTCVICGEDCAGRPRTKDVHGRYYCMPCYEQAKGRLEQKRSSSNPDTPSGEEDPSALSELLDTVRDSTATVPDPVPPTMTQTPDTRSGIPTLPFSLNQPLPWPLIGLCLLGVITLASLLFGDLVTFLFFLFIAVVMINGYWIGAARIGALLGGLLAGALFGIPVGKALEGLCASVFHTSGTTNRILSIALCALVSVVLVTIALQILIGRLLKSRPQWMQYNRAVGSGLGLVEGVLLACLVIWSLLGLESIAAISLAQTGSSDGSGRPNPVSRMIVSMAQSTRGSAIGRLADTTNPLNEMRLLTLLADGMVVVNDPVAREAFINHPAIERIQENPSVQQALRMLKEDEALCDVLENGSLGEKLKAILSSPTLPAVFDQTDIVAELSPLADEIELAIGEAKERAPE
jgi:hypothetical protein